MESLARRGAGHHQGRPGVHARADGEPVSGREGEGREARLELQGRPDGALGVVLVRLGVAEAEPQGAAENGAEETGQLPADLPPETLEGDRGFREDLELQRARLP